MYLGENADALTPQDWLLVSALRARGEWGKYYLQVDPLMERS